MELISWQNEQAITEYEGAKSAVSKFMCMMEQGCECTLYYDKRSESLLYRKNGQAYALSNLSAGYQALIWMVFDIAYRMALLNPQLGEAVARTPGIVLIDELDIHLHPQWQWLVSEALRQVFPHVQFIVATHSPIVIASLKHGWIIDVRARIPKSQVWPGCWRYLKTGSGQQRYASRGGRGAEGIP